MKINLNSPFTKNQSVDQTDVSSRANKHANHSPNSEAIPRGGKASTVEISENARIYQHGTEAVNASTQSQSDRVAQLKKSIRDGSYKVDSGELADRILREHLNSDFGKNKL